MGRAKLHQARLPEVDWSVQDGEKEEEEGDSTLPNCLDGMSQNFSVIMQESADSFP